MNGKKTLFMKIIKELLTFMHKTIIVEKFEFVCRNEMHLENFEESCFEIIKS